MLILVRSVLGVAATLCMGAPIAAVGPTVSVAWENLQGTETPDTAALRTEDGVGRLGAGSPASGDGAVVALGYFTGATEGAKFAGTWVPLTGPQAANIPFQRTRVGDSQDGGALPDGFFTFLTDFDASNSAVYQRLPPDGTRLAIAIYDGTSIGGSTRFNIVTHDEWQWEEPDPILPTFLYLNPTSPGAVWLGGSESALRTTVSTAQFPGGAARAPARLVNISTRGFVGTGDGVLIPGFVLSGAGSTRLLIRAVGPGFPEIFGLQGTVSDPELRLVRQGDPQPIATSDDWSTQPEVALIEEAFATTGAFPIPRASPDAALVYDLPVSSGGFTATVAGKAGGTGIALAEVYLMDTSPDASVELANISTRGFVGVGDNIMIPGFVIGPGGPRRLLVRAAGPTWGARFGLAGVLPNPSLRVFSSNAPSNALGTNLDWEDDGQGPALAAAAAQVGAFPLNPGAADAALILDLPPSTDPGRVFTVQVSDSSGATGLVLTEIYALP